MNTSRSEHEKVEQFAQLLGRCQRRVFLYALALVHNAADAEEVLQETNLVLWRKFDEYQPGTHFDAWACRIARFEALKFRQRKGTNQRLFSDQFVESLASCAEAELEHADRRRTALAGCLARLSDKDRQLVLFRYQEKATTQSVAESLGRSVQGTRRSLHRIRTTLLECIERTLLAEERS